MTQKFQIRLAIRNETSCIIQIWARAVDATHSFFSDLDKRFILSRIGEFPNPAPPNTFWVAVNDADVPLGFYSAAVESLNMLFVDPFAHRCGVGRAIMDYCLSRHPSITTDVYEENESAIKLDTSAYCPELAV